MAKRSTLAFLRTEAGAGAVMAGAAALGLMAANSRLGPDYAALTGFAIPVRVGAFAQTLSLAGWVREGLMSLVFLVIGLQVKFEAMKGEASSHRRIVLPLVSAAAGLLAPAAFLSLTTGFHASPALWFCAGAGDTAAALTVLAAVGGRLPQSLRFFILIVAGADTLASVILSALASPASLHPDPLLGAAVILAMLALLGRWRAAPRLFYAAGIVLVLALALQGGISTALAAFACAAVTPVRARPGGQESVQETFTNGLHPYVVFAVVPLFLFTAAGAPLRSSAVDVTTAWLVVGAMTLVKPGAILLASALAALLRLGRKPLEASWLEMAGAALLCGAGLTFSLYAAGPRPEAGVVVGVLAGSLLSAGAGFAVLTLAARSRRNAAAPARQAPAYRAARRA